MAGRDSKLKVMISSSVYGFEDQLRQVAALLETLGYDVICSTNGTIKVYPGLSNLENCLKAVEECDLFIGIIRPYTGTGNIGEKNITFEEIKKAVELKKPCWFLAHRDVTFARNVCKYIKLKSGDEIIIDKNRLFDKLSVVIYDFAIKNSEAPESRTGNWVQEFYRVEEIFTYINTQFSDSEFIDNVLQGRLGDE